MGNMNIMFGDQHPQPDDPYSKFSLRAFANVVREVLNTNPNASGPRPSTPGPHTPLTGFTANPPARTASAASCRSRHKSNSPPPTNQPSQVHSTAKLKSSGPSSTGSIGTLALNAIAGFAVALLFIFRRGLQLATFIGSSFQTTKKQPKQVTIKRSSSSMSNTSRPNMMTGPMGGARPPPMYAPYSNGDRRSGPGLLKIFGSPYQVRQGYSSLPVPQSDRGTTTAPKPAASNNSSGGGSSAAAKPSGTSAQGAAKLPSFMAVPRPQIQAYLAAGVAFMKTFVVTFRTFARRSPFLAPIDSIADQAPNLQTAIVVVELVLLIWVLYLIAMLAQTAVTIIRFICMPVIYISRILGVKF